jgi:hypothetical protein
MKILIAVFFGFLIGNRALSQLDPFYFGTYINKDFTESYTIYFLDETTDDCFLVEREKYENYQTVYGESGFGICEEDGTTKIKLESAETPLIIEFEIAEDGLKIMSVDLGDGENMLFTELSEIETMESQTEEIYFSRQDGSELMVYPDGDQLGFTFYGLVDNKCEVNEFTGIMVPKNEEMSFLEYTGENGCKIEFHITTSSINVVEVNCSILHESNCDNWNGYYTMNQ